MPAWRVLMVWMAWKEWPFSFERFAGALTRSRQQSRPRLHRGVRALPASGRTTSGWVQCRWKL
jgi:hypothetical protein